MVFSATSGGKGLADEDIVDSLGLLLFWRESCLPGTSSSFLSDLAFRCQSHGALRNHVSWENLASRARSQVEKLIFREESKAHRPGSRSTKDTTVHLISSIELPHSRKALNRSTPSPRGSRLGDIIRSSSRSGRKRARLAPVVGLPLDLSEFEPPRRDIVEEKDSSAGDVHNVLESVDADDLLPCCANRPSRSSRSDERPDISDGASRKEENAMTKRKEIEVESEALQVRRGR